MNREVLLHLRTSQPAAAFCEEFLEVASDPWAGTYCKLPAGHAGTHSAHYPAEPNYEKPEAS